MAFLFETPSLQQEFGQVGLRANLQAAAWWTNKLGLCGWLCFAARVHGGLSASTPALTRHIQELTYQSV